MSMDSTVVATIISEERWLIDPSQFDDAVNPDRIVRYLPDVPREDLDALVTALKSVTSVANPKIGARSWTGTYTPGRVWLDWDQNKKLSLYQSLHAGTVAPISDVVTRRGCKYLETTTWYLAVTSVAALPANSSGIEYDRSEVVKDRETGRFTYSVTKRETLTQTVGTYTAAANPFETTARRTVLGVRDGDVDSNGAAVSIPDPAAAAVGTTVDVARSKNPDCTQDVAVETKTAVAVSNASIEGSATLFEVSAADTDRNQAAAGTPPVSQTPGAITQVRSDLNEFGKYDIRTETRTAQPVSDAENTKEIRAFETLTAVADRHQTTAVVQETVQTAGQIVQTAAEKDEFGRYTNRTQTRAATAVADATVEGSATLFEVSAADTDRNQAAAGTPPVSQTPGAITQVRSDLNEFGKYDIRTETRTAQPVSDAEKTKEIRAFETLTAVADRHQTTAVVQETVQTAGQIVQTAAEKDEFGRYTNRTQTRASTAVSDATVEGSATLFEVSAADTDRNQAQAGTPPVSQTAGAITQVRSDLNEFGKYDIRTETRTAQAVSNAEKTKEIRADMVVTAVADRHQTTAVVQETVQTPGQIVQTAAEKDEFGRFTNRTQTRVRQDNSLSGVCVVQSPRVSSVITIIDGAENPPAALGVNDFGEIRVRKDEFGRYVGEKRVDTYETDISVPGWTISTLGTYTIAVKTYRQTKGGDWYLGTTPMTYVVKQHATEKDAWDALGNDGTAHDFMGHTSRVKSLSNGQYVSIKVSKGTTTWALEAFP